MSNSFYCREKSTDEILICKTNRVQDPVTTETVTVEFDLQARRQLTETFNFKPDPTISGISPLSSFHSGGRKITVDGAHFDVIQKPMMYYRKGNNRSNMTVRLKNKIRRCWNISSIHNFKSRLPEFTSIFHG